MQEDLVLKMASFGFTVNQAKVYLSIVQSGKTRVGRISKGIQLHRHDIYKLLPKLEKMGLITNTIDRPFMVEAIPIENALETLILKERQRANQKISHMENNLKEIVNAIQLQPETKEEARFTLYTSDEAIKSRGHLLIKKTKREFKIIISMEHITEPLLHDFRNFLQMIAEKDAKIKLIIVSTNDEEEIRQIVENIAPNKGQFRAKLIYKSICKDYQVVNNKEVWIETQQKTETGRPCLFWTNDLNIVNVYVDDFKRTWAHLKTSLVSQNYITPSSLSQK